MLHLSRPLHFRLNTPTPPPPLQTKLFCLSRPLHSSRLTRLLQALVDFQVRVGLLDLHEEERGRSAFKRFGLQGLGFSGIAAQGLGPLQKHYVVNQSHEEPPQPLTHHRHKHHEHRKPPRNIHATDLNTSIIPSGRT